MKNGSHWTLNIVLGVKSCVPDTFSFGKYRFLGKSINRQSIDKINQLTLQELINDLHAYFRLLAAKQNGIVNKQHKLEFSAGFFSSWLMVCIRI